MNQPTKRLIINADDFGLTPDITRGILTAHHQGVVSSTTVMMTSSYAETALHMAMNTAPNLGLGVHLTLTGRSHRPLTAVNVVPSLVNDQGYFYPLDERLARYDELNSVEISHEFAAQVARFVAIVGHAPDHLDAHHHMAYRHAGALQAMIALAQAYNIPIRNVGITDQTRAGWQALIHDLPPASRENADKAIRQVIASINEINQDTAQRPLFTTDHFWQGFYAEGAILGDLLNELVNLPIGSTEIMCHPGYVSDALQSDYMQGREQEIKVLTHKSVREVIAAQGITLTTFKALSKA